MDFVLRRIPGKVSVEGRALKEMSLPLHAGLEGATAAAVGLLFAMAVHSGIAVIRPANGCVQSTGTTAGLGALAVVAATFICIGVLRWPTVPTVLGVMPFSVALAFSAARYRSQEAS